MFRFPRAAGTKVTKKLQQGLSEIACQSDFLVITLFFRMCFAKLKIPMTLFQKGDDELEIVS
jgi:hypothetical protein